jgi:hypothetical protein
MAFMVNEHEYGQAASAGERKNYYKILSQKLCRKTPVGKHKQMQ